MRTGLAAAATTLAALGLGACVDGTSMETGSSVWALAGPGPASVEAVRPSCDPRILTTRFPGLVDATGSGVGTTRLLRVRTAGVTSFTTATVAWSYRAIVSEPEGGDPRVSHDIGGYIDIDITTGERDQIHFRGHCIAAAGSYGIPFPGFTQGQVILYADGITTGWPAGRGGPAARQTLVHFEAALLPDGRLVAYVAIVGGQDCALDFSDLIVTDREPLGFGTYENTPNQTILTETDCGLLGGPGRSLGVPLADLFFGEE